MEEEPVDILDDGRIGEGGRAAGAATTDVAPAPVVAPLNEGSSPQAVAGTQYSAVVAPAPFGFLPIPLAWIMLKLARKGRSMLPGTAEIRDLASGELA